MMGQQEKRDLQKELDSVNESLDTVLAIGMSGAEAEDAEGQIYDILQRCIDLMKADAAVVLLREGNELTSILGLGAEGDVESDYTCYVGQGFAGKIAQTKEHIFVHNAQEDPLVISPHIKRSGIHSMLGVPLVYGGEAIGVLHVDWMKTHMYSELELEVLTMAAERCASAIAIARMCEINNELNTQACMYLDIIEHDLNNLNEITLSDLDTLKSIPHLDREAKDTIDGVMMDVSESKTLINNVRKLHKTLSNDLPIETMDLDGIIKYALNEVQWPETKDVVIHYSPEVGRAINGTEILKDVFFSLVNNAVSCSRGPVEIGVNVDKIHVQEQPYYMVTVSDNAQQIPDDVKSELFTFHLGMTQSYGKALPMFLVRLIVDRMGGDIRVEDRVPGDYSQGSEFIITLPAIEGPVVPETEPAYP
jgi:K+-sensing histidine kinase KdpD